jgi:predicted  nucleic acid-binding Zn-ribbon protein
MHDTRRQFVCVVCLVESSLYDFFVRVRCFCGRLHPLVNVVAIYLFMTQVTQRAERAETQVAALQQQLQRTQQYLTLFKRDADARAVTQSATIMRATEKLARYEERMTAAAERVSFAAAMVAQREVTVRNNMAILNAERRMLATATSAGVSHSAQDSAGSGNEVRPEFSLSAEAESFLLAVFTALDPQDSGRVSAQLLVDCFFQPPAEEHGSDTADAQGEATHSTRVGLTPTGQDVAAAVGPDLWHNLSHALLNSVDRETDLTWAELLLHLLPSPGRSEASTAVAAPLRATTLTAQDLRGLRDQGLLGDSAWGVLPLQLPGTTQSRTAPSANNSNGTSAEVVRLRRERSYLLQRLQDMSRTLERRAEGIRAYFEASINREKLVAERAVLQLSEAQRSLVEARARVNELEVRLQESQERYRTHVPQLQDEVQALQERLELRQTEAVTRAQLALAAQVEKVTALEAQITSLTGAAAKKDVKIRTLERQVTELTKGQTTKAVEMDRLRELLLQKDNEVQEATAVLEERWGSERGQLSDTIAQLQQERSTLTDTIAELQATLEEVRTQYSAADAELKRLQGLEATLQVALQEVIEARNAMREGRCSACARNVGTGGGGGGADAAAGNAGGSGGPGAGDRGSAREGASGAANPYAQHPSSHQIAQPQHHTPHHQQPAYQSQHQAAVPPPPQPQQRGTWGEDEQKAHAYSAAREPPRIGTAFARLDHLLQRTAPTNM